jgi:hypothetical protein
MIAFSPGSRGRLTLRDRGRFPGKTLFDSIGRAVCDAACLPRKELFESWEVARRTRRLIRGGRVVDMAGGHGLLAHVMLLLDDSSPTALVVDSAIPASALKVQDALVRAWPRLAGRIAYVHGPIDSVELEPDDVVVSSHACGALTDHVIARAIDARSRVAVLPCCHDAAVSETGNLRGWLDSALAIDVARALRLERHGYRVWTQTISPAITPKNRCSSPLRLDPGGLAYAS